MKLAYLTVGGYLGPGSEEIVEAVCDRSTATVGIPSRHATNTNRASAELAEFRALGGW